MKIVCSTKKLNKIAQILQRALPTKAVNPVLTGIFIKAEDNKVEFQSTDYEIGISFIMEADIRESGQAILPGNYFVSLIRRLSGETVEINKSREENKIIISSGGYQTDLVCMPVEEYPVINKLAVSNFVKIKDEIFKDLIKKTVFACSTDDSRPVFTGVLMTVKGKEVAFIATNTHRMALRKCTLDTENGNFSMIIPSRALREIERINIGDLPEDILISWKNRQMAVRVGDIYVESLLIEGSFPDYKRVIPSGFSKTAKFRAADLQAAVERVSLLFKDGEYNVIRLNIDNGKIVITSNNPEMGKAQEAIECENEGGQIEIAFNSRYIIDILKQIDCENAVISLNSSVSPACVSPENDENYSYIVTPVRVAY